MRYVLRSLRRSPGFTTLVILTLGLGIGAATLIFSIAYAVLIRPLPYPQPERLFTLWQRDPQKGVSQDRVTPANFADWRDQTRTFQHLGFYPSWPGSQTFRLAEGDRPERVRGAYASSGLFQALGVQPLLGRTFGAGEDQTKSDLSAILSYGLWQRRFAGARDIVGRTVTVDTYGWRTYTIIGVMPPGFDFPDHAEIWLAAGWMGVQVPPPGASNRCCSWLVVVGRLQPRVALEQAQVEMNTMARRILAQYPDTRFGSEVAIVPLLDHLAGSTRRPLFILLGAVAFLLLIACVNVANLMLSRSVARQQETAIRAVLGAGRRRLIGAALLEGLLLSLSGAAAGCGLAAAGLRLVKTIEAGKIPRLAEASLDPAVLAFALALSLLTGILFTLAPAWYAREVVIGSRQWAPHTTRPRTLLVVAEFAFATVLLVGAGLLIESFLRLRGVDPGFRPESVLTAGFDMTGRTFAGRTPPRIFFRDLMARIRALPGVQSVGGASMLPLSDQGGAAQPLILEGRPIMRTADAPKAKTGGATPDYFRVLGVPLLQGRFFTESDGAETPSVVIINQAMAKRYWPGEDPLGRGLALGSSERFNRTRAGPGNTPEWTRIIGVVADMRGVGLDTEPRPELYYPYWQWPWYEVDLVVRTTGDPGTLAAAVRREAEALDKNALITRMRTMEDIVGESIAQPRFRAGLLGVFAASALLLAAFGIYAVVSFSVTQRTHEMGIRMALGAQRADLLRMVLWDALLLAAIGVVLGLLAAVALSRLIASLLFGVGAINPLTFATVALLLGSVALAAAAWPALRAARVDPMNALRHL